MASKIWTHFDGGKRLVVIVGGPGQGKSQLALHIGSAMHSKGKLSGGAYYIDMCEAKTPDMVISR